MQTWQHHSRERHIKNRYSATNRSAAGDDTYADDVGILGELLFARFMHLPTDGIGSDGPTSGLFVLQDGTKVAVQSAGKKSNTRLIVPPKKVQTSRADVFAFTNVDLETEELRFSGWATWEEVADAPVVELRRGAPWCHALGIERLRPLEELRERAKPHMLTLF